MTYPDDPVSFPSDPHPVRPGTSDALFARTIDATPQPPLVRAQETVATAIPRLTSSLSDPLFVVTLAATLVLMWLAFQMRSRLRPVLLFGIMMLTLTSFRPVRSPDQAPMIADDRIAAGYERARRFERREAAPPIPEPAPFVRRAPEPPPFSFRVPPRRERLRPDFDRIRQDEEELRAAIEELRYRIEAELRRRGEHHYYQTRAARWFRRLPPELREWVVESHRAVASRDRDD
jgi:hypothetical protein